MKYEVSYVEKFHLYRVVVSAKSKADARQKVIGSKKVKSVAVKEAE